jgi:hypothetical protein
MEQIRQLTLRLLDGAASGEELRRACARLYRWFMGATSLDATPREGVRLPTGLALAPALAAQCVLDTNRTVAFVRLRDYDSGLTVPEILWPLSPAREGEVIEFTYALGTAPGIRWRRR